MSRQKIFSASKVTVDARKLLGSFNDGFAGQLNVLERKLVKYGEEFDKKLRLASANSTTVHFEDVGANKYYKADYKKVDNNIVFENVTEMNIVDEKKSEVFNKACTALVHSIHESMDENGDILDNSKISKVFKQIEAGYFTPKVIPESGIVRTRDNKIHHITVSESYIPAEIYPSLKIVVNESIKSGAIKFVNGNIISEGKSESNPISEFTKRQVAIRRMRSIAENAYNNLEFRTLIKGVATKISNKNIKEAIQLSKEYLSNEQEFCTLNKSEIRTLVENSLFSEGVFNTRIVRDASELVWRTNIVVNRNDILKEWKVCSEKAKVQAFANNVKILHESSMKSYDSYSDSYDRFITSVIKEDVSSKAIKSQAYLNMLKLLKNVISGSDADQAVADTVTDLIIKLEGDINNIDDALLYEVEDLLATTSPELIKDTASLADFDKVPEVNPVDDFGGDDVMLGDFDGDMGDDISADLGGGLPSDGDDLAIDDNLDLGGDAATDEGEEIPGETEGGEGEGSGDEELEGLLDLAHIIRDSKPISEMSIDDIKTISEKIKKSKNLKVDKLKTDDEFKNFKNSESLNESQIIWFKSLMSKASGLDQNVSDSIKESYTNLVVGEVVVNEEAQETEETASLETVNDDYTGEEIDESIDNNKILDIIQQIVSADSASVTPAAPAIDIAPIVDVPPAITPVVDPAPIVPAIDPVPAIDAGPVDTDAVQDSDIPAPETEEDDKTIMDCDMSEGKDKKDSISEDSNITDPASKEYTSEAEAKLDADGKKTNAKLKLSDEDYDGTTGANTGKNKPKTGLNS